jgi:hypothetical protein
VSDTLTIEYRRLDEVARWPRNVKRHDIGALVESIRRYGFVDPPKFDGTLGALVYGNGRDEALEWMRAQGDDPPRGVKVDTDGMWLMPVKVGIDAPSEAEAEALALDHNNLTMAGGDFTAWDMSKLWGEGYTDILASLATSDALPITVDGDALDGLLRGMADDILGGATDEGDGSPAIEAPDSLFPSDNEWGIPLLDTRRQAHALTLPCERWGRVSRHTTKMPGTWHFYTDDYKFSALWSDPTPVLFSGCSAIIEPNVSSGPATPRAVALWGIYRKRWLARWAQSYGVGVFVDLNIEPAFVDLNLLGVPKGWRSYATRGYDQQIGLLDMDYHTACEQAETDDIIFVVVGGGQESHRLCQERGWVHVPQESHVVEGREYLHGT